MRIDFMNMNIENCILCNKEIPLSTDHSIEDEGYMIVCNDCRDEIGNGGI